MPISLHRPVSSIAPARPARPARAKWSTEAAGVLATLATGLAGPAALAQPQFIPLGFLDGTTSESYAWGISADGSTIVGESSSASAGSQTEAFRFVGAGPMVGLGSLNGANVASVANAVSATGQVIVGFSRSNPSGVLFTAFRDANGLIAPADNLGDLPGSSTISNALGVSADGRFVVGYGTTVDPVSGGSRRQAYRYDAQQPGGGFRALTFLPGDRNASAYGISSDGLVVAGQSSSPTRTSAVIWTFDAAGTLIATVGLPALPGGSNFSEAWGISGSGLVVVGDSESGNGPEAAKWIGGVVTGLGDLPGGAFSSSALAASGDGSIIVGYGTSATSGFLGEAVYWDAAGIHSIKDSLAAAGVDLTGWDLEVANAVSADGRRIVGNGTDPTGAQQAWLVVLPPRSACTADFNNDTRVDPDDLSDYITGFFSLPPDPRTDFNGDLTVDPDDLSDFITMYFSAECQ